MNLLHHRWRVSHQVWVLVEAGAQVEALVVVRVVVQAEDRVMVKVKAGAKV